MRIKHDYQLALESARYKFNLTCQKWIKQQIGKEKIIIYSTFSLTVTIRIGTDFFDLFNKPFDANQTYHKIFKGNILEISYSCMENFKKILKTITKY